MDDHLLELIPFYVAGTLTATEAAEVDALLARSEAARQAVTEWRTIAHAVQSEAVQWARQLPPLSPAVLSGLDGTGSEPTQVMSAAPSAPAPDPTRRIQVVAPPDRYTEGIPAPVRPRVVQMPPPARKHTASRMPGLLTIGAAAAVVLILGGLVLLAALGLGGDGDDDQQIALLATPDTENPFGSAPGTGGGVEIKEDMTDLGILPTPSSPPPNPPTPEPTLPPPSMTPVLTLPPILTRTPTDDAISSIMIDGVCMVQPNTQNPASIYAEPGTQSTIVGFLQPGEMARAWAQDGRGWFRIGGDTAVEGWVVLTSIVTSGPCDELVIETAPTATSPNECYLTTIDSFAAVNVRSGPGTSYGILNAFGPSDRVLALGRSDNGWYRVEFRPFGTVVVGWIDGAQVREDGSAACANLFVYPAAQYTPDSVVRNATVTPPPPPTATP